MNTDEGKIWYGLGLDTKGLQADAARARAVFGGIADQAQVQAGRIDSSYKSLGATIARMGGAVGLGMLAKELYTFAGAFDKSMREVSTISETVSADVDGFKRQILALGTEVPIGADAAAKALYQIVSAGHDGAKGMQILEVSAKAAIGGVTETVTAADAITTVLNAYKKDASEAASISDQLFTTARLGKTTFGELGQSISQAVPIAASFGIESEQVLAAVATLTKSGTPTAQAMTQIRASIIAASKALGDGYFQTHTFQEGLVEIANRAGGSESELRALVPEIEAMNGILGLTGINAKTAASDLAELGNSAGASEKAFAKMNAEAGAQLTILKNNILKKFHEVGQGVVDITGSMAKFLNSDGLFSDSAINDMISSLVVLVATLGTYKATMMASNAIQRVGNNVQYAAEMAELVKLLPAKAAAANADIAQAVAKGHLSQATAERLMAIRAEVAEELKALQIKAQIAASQAAEAATLEQIALKKALYAERVERQAQQELSSAQLKGNAERIRRAEIKLTFAEEGLNIALKEKGIATDNLATASLKANTAATAVDTMQSGINAAASTGAAKAKTLWTIATGKLTNAFKSLKLAFASNPIGMILTGVTMAISLFTMFGDSVKKTTEQSKALAATVDGEVNKALLDETTKLQSLRRQISESEPSSKKRIDLIKELKREYPDIIENIDAEKASLDKVTGSIDAYISKLSDKIRLQVLEQKYVQNIKSIEDAKITLASGGDSNEYAREAKRIREENALILEQIEYQQNLVRHSKEYADLVKERKEIKGDVEVSSMMPRTPDTREEYESRAKELARSAKSDGLPIMKLEPYEAYLKRFEENITEADKKANRLKTINAKITEAEHQKTSSGGGVNGSKTASKDYSTEVVDIMLKAEQLKIEAMQAGREKELAQIEQTKKEKLAAIDKEQKEVADLLQQGGLPKEQQAHLIQKSANLEAQKPIIGQQATNDTAAVNEKYDDEIADNWKALTSVFLSEEEKRSGAIRDEYTKRRKWLDEYSKGGSISEEQRVQLSMQIDASEAKEQLDALTADYQTYADQRKAIEDKFNADLAALQAKNKDGKLDGNIKEVEKQKKAALSKVKVAEASDDVDFTKLFGNLDNLTLPAAKELRNKIKVWIDEAGNSLAPEDLKAVSDAFQKLELKIADQDPFAILKSSIGELKTANEEVTQAQKAYNAALAAGGKDSDAATKAAEAYNAALDKRAAAVAKANEAIGSIADKGQQIVGAAQDVLGIMGDLGVKVPENIANAIGGIGQIMDGLGSIDLAQPLSIVTGAVKMLGGLVKTVASLFNGDSKREDEIGRLQGKIDALGSSYDALHKAAEKAYSTDAAKLIDQSNELIEKQKALILLQIAEEEGKKDTDSGKIDGWKKQLEELDQKAGENVEKKVDLVLGSDYKSDVDSFVSSYMDSFGVVGQGAKEMADQMKKNIIQGLLSTDIGAAVERARKKMEGLVADGDLSQADMDQIDTMSEEINRIMDQRGKMYEGLLGKDEDTEEVKNENTFTGAIRGSVATEASVAELGGLFRSQTDSLMRIDSKLGTGMVSLLELARTNAAIELNTQATAAHTAQTVSTLATGFQELKSELSAINKNTTKDTGSYGQ